MTTRTLKRTIAIAATTVALAGLGSTAAFAAHSSVDNPSGCHETNFNAAQSASGNDAWTNSAGGHDKAEANSPVHKPGGC